MKNLLCAAVAFLTVSLLSGCAAPKNSANTAAAPAASVCVISGQPLKADGPSVDFQGQKVGFCCENCLGKWHKLDDAGKQAKLAPKQ